MQEDSDELIIDKLLEAGPVARSSDDLRMRLRSKTSAIVGRRRVLRRGGLALSALVAFGAGWTARTWMPSSPGIQIAERPAQAPPQSKTESIEQADRVVDISEYIARRARAAADINSYEYWRNSGNHQLLDRNDLTGALRSYRRALDAATIAELQREDQDDTWLLAELKYDRQRNLAKELPHADESL
jgi:hypothetical protein